MNFLEMILPVSSDNSLVQIYVWFVKNSILLSMLVILEDVIREYIVINVNFNA